MRRLGVALQRAQNTLHRETDQYARTLGLTGTQLSIIDFLSSSSPDKKVYQRDLELEFNIRKSTATNILKLMENKGLIIKKTEQEDTRLKEINLTPKAQKIEVKIDSFLNNSENKFEQLLGKEDKQDLVDNLLKLEHFA